MIFDTESNEILTLEKIVGIRVITSSEIRRPVDNDGGRTRPRAEKPTGRRKKGERICKKCGQPGHMKKTCPN